MTVCFPFHNADSALAMRLLRWINRIGGCKSHDCVLVSDAGVSWPIAADLLTLACEAFRTAKVIVNSSPVEGWIPGSSSLFFTAANHCQKNGVPFLWLEPDTTPLKPHWLDQIGIEYSLKSKPFMGHIYKCDQPDMPKVLLSGIAVYPHDAFSRLKAWRDSPLPFDVATAYVTVPESAHTDLVQHYWGIGIPPINPAAVLFHRDKHGVLMKRIEDKQPRLDLRDVTLWSIAWGNPESIRRVKSVLRYCQTIAEFGSTILFSTDPEHSELWKTVEVKCGNFSDFNALIDRVVPFYLISPFAMSVQEDGFPIQPELWTEEFLEWDYIGAPWLDGVVGNGGFYIESQRMIRARMNLPDNPDFQPPMGNADYWLCRTNRVLLESQGMRFAPCDLAAQFSSECSGHNKPSFGFHGRTYNPEKYRNGWQLIARGEQ